MLDSYTITQYVAACASKAGVSVKWVDGAVPSTNGRTITLPYLSAYSDNESKVRLMQYVKHETSHVLYSDFELLQKNNPQGLLAFINNLLEDHRVDYLNDSQYLGDKHNTEEFMRLHAEEVKDKPMSDEARDIYIPLFAWDYDIRDDLWTRTADPYTDMSVTGKKVYDKLHSADYASVLRNIRTIEDKTQGDVEIYNLAKRILTEVFGVAPESMEGESAEARIAKANKPDENGDKSDDAKDIQNIKAEDHVPLPYSEHGDKTHSKEVVNPRTSKGYGDYKPTPANKIKEYNFYTQKGNWKPIENTSNASKYIGLSHRGESLTNQIRAKLQIMTRDRYEYGKKKGKLNGNSLYRVGLQNAHGFNERLFKQKIVNKQLDMAVQILVDASGSMCGRKYDYASASAIILNKVLGNALQIPVEIIAFTDEPDNHKLFIIKDFDGKVGDTHVANSFSSVSNYLWDNVDGESLVYGYTRINKRKEKRKLMIVLSDGAPCGGHHRGDINTYTRNVIKNIENSKTELIGVGLCYRGVGKYYKRNAVIDNAQDIELALLNLISNNILKGAV